MKASSGLTVGFGILLRGMDKISFEKVIDIYYEMDKWLQAIGGKRFLSGWLGRSLNKGWHQHYGNYYNIWKSTKQKYDPNNVFQSILFEKEFNKI